MLERLNIERFRAPASARIRGLLVEIIWQHRRLETIPFLAEALSDASTAVWQNALDGLVALGGPPALAALQAAREQLQPGQPADRVRAQWYDEAIKQIREGLESSQEPGKPE